MIDKTLNALRRKLEQWELSHLRQHCAELAERLEAAEARARDAEDWAEYWRENAFNLQQELMDGGFQIGLTKEGALIAIQPDLPTDAQVRNDSIEQINGSAHKDHAVTIAGAGQNHLDTRPDRISNSDINPMNSSSQSGSGEVGAEQMDAFIPGIGDCADIEVADDHGHAEALATGANSQDGQLNAIDRRQQGATDLHEPPSKVTWPSESETSTPIDWSPLVDRPVILHPDKGQDKP